MKKNSLTSKSDGELSALLAEKREALRVFRFAVSGSKTKNIREARVMRRTIARALTEIGARNRASK